MVSPKARSGDDGVACDYCNEHSAVLYCRADSAKLCLLCDNLVHSANALSRKHLRSQICDNCASQPVSSRCDTDNLLLCQDCDWDAHGTTTSSHGRSPVDAFSGCPSALHLASSWGLDLLAAANRPPPQQHIVNWTSCYQDPPDNDANNINTNNKNPLDSSSMYDVNKSLLQDLMVPSGNWNDRIIYSTTDAVGSKKQKQQVVLRQLIELFKREGVGVGVDCGGEELVSDTSPNGFGWEGNVEAGGGLGNGGDVGMDMNQSLQPRREEEEEREEAPFDNSLFMVQTHVVDLKDRDPVAVGNNTTREINPRGLGAQVLFIAQLGVSVLCRFCFKVDNKSSI